MIIITLVLEIDRWNHMEKWNIHENIQQHLCEQNL